MLKFQYFFKINFNDLLKFLRLKIEKNWNFIKLVKFIVL